MFRHFCLNPTMAQTFCQLARGPRQTGQNFTLALMRSASLHVGHLTFVSLVVLSVFIRWSIHVLLGAIMLKGRAEPEAPPRSVKTEDRLTCPSPQP